MDLYDYETSEYIRPATPDEVAASNAVAKIDGGAGVFTLEIDEVERKVYTV